MSLSFEDKLHHVLNSYEIAGSRHLSAFSLDIRYHLEHTNLFRRVTVRKTSKPEYNLAINCTVSDAHLPPSEVAQTLERVLCDALLYGNEEDAYELQVKASEVCAHFITVDDSVVVIGRIKVEGLVPS